MKVAVIGQSAFGSAVYEALVAAGHTVTGVFTIPDSKPGKSDVLAEAASKNGTPVFKVGKWQAAKSEGGAVLPAVLEQYKTVVPDLNVLAFCTQFIPNEVADFPKYGSIVYHPSVLPAHRGASAISWALINGDATTGLTVFFADDGLDTGPILLTKETNVEPDDTVVSIYKRFMFPEGVKSMVEAVEMIAAGTAPRISQEGMAGASYDPMLKKSNVGLDMKMTAQQVHNFIRGCDRVPGAWITVDGKQVSLFGSRRCGAVDVASLQIKQQFLADGTTATHFVCEDGVYLCCGDGEYMSVERVEVDKRSMPSCQFLMPASEASS